MLKGIIQALKINRPIPKSLNDVLTRRDFVEHPNQERLYNMIDWKDVHLAWVLSGEIESYLDPMIDLINEINKNFDKYLQSHPIPGKLEGVQRGLKAEEPFKKVS